MSESAELLAIFGDPPPTDLVRTLDLGGYKWKAVTGADDVTRHEPSGGWAGAVVACDADPETAWALCRALRKRDIPVAPLLVLLSGGQLADLSMRDDLFDDFCLTPFHPIELEARLRHMLRKNGNGASATAARSGSEKNKTATTPKTMVTCDAKMGMLTTKPWTCIRSLDARLINCPVCVLS